MKPYMATRILLLFALFCLFLAFIMAEVGGPESMDLTGNDASKFLSNPLARWMVTP